VNNAVHTQILHLRSSSHTRAREWMNKLINISETREAPPTHTQTHGYTHSHTHIHTHTHTHTHTCTHKLMGTHTLTHMHTHTHTHTCTLVHTHTCTLTHTHTPSSSTEIEQINSNPAIKNKFLVTRQLILPPFQAGRKV